MAIPTVGAALDTLWGMVFPSPDKELFFQALTKGDIEGVQRQLDLKMDVNSPMRGLYSHRIDLGIIDSSSIICSTPLILAIVCSPPDVRAEMVKRIVAAGARVDQADEEGRTAFSEAAKGGYINVVERLLIAGASVHKTDGDGQTALHKAAENGHTGMVERLLGAGAEINQADRFGRTALHKAAENGHTGVVERLLIAGASVHKTDGDGQTALHKAAENRHTGVVKSLVNAGAEINQADRFDGTALDRAVEKGHTEVVESLVNAGATIQNHSDSGLGTALHTAVRKRNTEVIESLLRIPGIIIDELIDGGGRTPFLWAAEGGNIEVMEMLRAAGADVNKTDKCNQSALHKAAENGHTGAVEWLVDAGTRIDHKEYVAGNTALFEAALNGHTKVVKMLVDAGAKINLSNCRNLTPMHMAVIEGHTEIVAVLLAARAAVDLIDDLGETPLYKVLGARYTDDKKEALIALLMSHWAELNEKVSAEATKLGNIRINDALRKGQAERSYKLRFAIMGNRIAANWQSYIESLKGKEIGIVESADDKLPSLHLAVKSGDIARLKQLIVDGTENVNAKDEHGQTALYYAAYYGSEEAIEELKKAGAEDLRTNKGFWACNVLAKRHPEKAMRLLPPRSFQAE